MEDKNFLSHIASWIYIIWTASLIISSMITYIYTQSWMLSIISLLGISIVILVLLFHKSYNDHQALIKIHNELKDCNGELSQDLDDANNRFIQQSTQYNQNINELNLHKQVTHIVVSLVDAEKPKTEEGKRLIRTLESSTSEIVRKSDKNEFSSS